MLDLSISIVSYNTRELLRNCLKSIFETTKGIEFEVIIVDNNSRDGSQEMVAKEFPQVKLIANDSNRGFAGANNQAIKESKGRHILLLNSDTIVLEDTLEICCSFMDEHLEIGLLGCKLLNPDGTLQHSCRGFPSFLTLFFESTFLDQIFPRHGVIGRYQMRYWDHDEIREVDQPMGAFMMVRREAIEEVGYMDEGYFMFFEEVDWCYRIKDKGWKIVFIPQAEIIHYGGQSIRKAQLSMFFAWHKSRLRFFAKRYKNLPPSLVKGSVVALGLLQPIIILGVLIGGSKLIGRLLRL